MPKDESLPRRRRRKRVDVRRRDGRLITSISDTGPRNLPPVANTISGQVRPERDDGEAAEAKGLTHRGSGELALDAARVLDRVPPRFLYREKRVRQHIASCDRNEPRRV